MSERTMDQELDELGLSEEPQMIRLNATDSRALAEALLNPRKPNTRLEAAAQRYLKLIGD